ncbi:CBS domain-containing protein CBSX5-like [Hibiscus syriacus]|uniref:CBS domain-containing protein CBSX5-like n=1 Tax=Hibiscus syriacus TaxID=106335 RepID=A0A6A3C230_HIBSY|nr:CBS domain-containing protein CBSX5-like [Hibiscus syriacus]
MTVTMTTSTLENVIEGRSSPFDPIQSPLFHYPPSYGEHKYAITTHRHSCSSPVFFSGYGKVVEEIHNSCKNSSAFSPALKYLQAKRDTFGGNLNFKERFSYFNHTNNDINVPCRFLKEFPVSDSDRMAMESCNGVVVASAIFNDHDKIRQPIGLGSKTLEIACFFMFIDDITLQGLYFHKLIPQNSPDYKVGVWRIVEVFSDKLYENPAMNGVIPKYLVHRLFPNSKFSVWMDAKVQLTVDPLLLIHSLIVSEDADMAISKHPYYIHTMEEAMATVRWRKWSDIDGLTRQMETYCERGLQPWTQDKLPYTTDVPDSALILRKHGPRSNLFSCLLFNELEGFNPRDQLGFAFVRDRMNPKLKLNMFEVEVFEKIVVEYGHNLKRFGDIMAGPSGEGIGPKRAGHGHFFFNHSRCHNYLLTMWGEAHG